MQKVNKTYLVIFFLIILNIIIWFFNFNLRNSKELLKVYFIDVGQGDAIFIEAPNGVQMLIDAGRDAGIVSKLGRITGFFDNNIDIVLATHPDSDHIGGMPLVFDRYKVSNFVDSLAIGENQIYKSLVEKINIDKSNYFFGERGMIIWLDKVRGVYFQVYYPDSQNIKSTDTNELSIIGKLVYGDISFLLTGDAGKMPETILYTNDGELLKSEVLKVGHHGSRNSSSPYFIEMVNPKYAIISAGLNNSYGHPHKEVMDILRENNIEILETGKEGTVKFYTNGIDLWRP